MSAAPAAAVLLATLPPTRWAIVTSATPEIATARLRAASLPVPRVLICADDVRAGKPSPDGYLAAAAQLPVVPTDCVVVEDTPSGIEAARAAGMFAVAVTTTHTTGQLADAHLVIGSLGDLMPALRQLFADRSP